MKKLIFILFGFLFFASCNEAPLDPHSVITPPSGPETEFDQWILDNYTYPYNIAIKYKLQDIETDRSYYLAPAYPEKCEPLSKVLKYIWIETFNEVVGVDFFREHSPKVVFFVGSWALNSTGSYVLGTAESGMKITLYGVNDFNPDSIDKRKLQEYMCTVIHEFCHILHQKKAFDPEFEKISSADYVGDDWDATNNTEALAQSMGFYTRYSRKNKNEDFVELIAHYTVYGQSQYDALIARVGPEAAAKINQKFEIVKNYLQSTWGIDIYTFNRVFTRRLETVEMINLN